MDILIMGGTAFFGRASAQAALDRGHRVTTFNRGRTGADVPGVEALRGDRENDDDLAQLAGRHFDGVVDTCGFVPRVVGRSVSVLRDAAEHYVFVSSCSATTTWPTTTTPDDAEGQPCPSDAGPDDGDYGVLKAGCERAVTEAYGDAATVMRAGLILGPHENVGRLTWWLSRMSRGGETIAPGDPDRAMQLVDARDLAAFAVGAIERRVGGTFNTTGPRGNATMAGWLGAAREVAGGQAELTWVDDAFLLAHEVGVWQELPLWSPTDQEVGVWDVDTAAAEAAGLTTRPVADTVRDTWAWMVADGVRPDDEGGRFGTGGRFGGNGMVPDREAALLAAWHAR
jgi:2'-hydroxyisoflavone reductase